MRAFVRLGDSTISGILLLWPPGVYTALSLDCLFEPCAYASGPDHQPQRDRQSGQQRQCSRGGIALADGSWACVLRLPTSAAYSKMSHECRRDLPMSAGRCAGSPGAGGLDSGRPPGGPPAQHLLRQQVAGVLQGATTGSPVPTAEAVPRLQRRASRQPGCRNCTEVGMRMCCPTHPAAEPLSDNTFKLITPAGQRDT
jgi:hypothetical protein